MSKLCSYSFADSWRLLTTLLQQLCFQTLRIPKVGIVFLGIRRALTPFRTAFTTAQRRIQEVVEKYVERFKNMIERATLMMSQFNVILELASTATQSLAEISQSTCIREATSEILGFDFFDKLEGNAGRFLNAADGFTDGVLQVFNDAWDSFEPAVSTIGEVLNAFNPIIAVLKPLKELSRFLDHEITTPWLRYVLMLLTIFCLCLEFVVALFMLGQSR